MKKKYSNLYKTTSTNAKWRSPIEDGNYNREENITSKEREAIEILLQRRFRWGKRNSNQNRPYHKTLERLTLPITDSLEYGNRNTVRAHGTIIVLLEECLMENCSYWGWTSEKWIAVIGKNSREFRKHKDNRFTPEIRLDVAAVAYLIGGFRDVLSLGRFERRSLANRVFGESAVSLAINSIIGPLKDEPVLKRDRQHSQHFPGGDQKGQVPVAEENGHPDRRVFAGPCPLPVVFSDTPMSP